MPDDLEACLSVPTAGWARHPSIREALYDRACQHAGVEPRFEEWTGECPTSCVLSISHHRRHLTDGQRAARCQTAKAIKERAPDLAERVHAGKMSVHAAAKADATQPTNGSEQSALGERGDHDKRRRRDASASAAAGLGSSASRAWSTASRREGLFSGPFRPAAQTRAAW